MTIKSQLLLLVFVIICKFEVYSQNYGVSSYYDIHNSVGEAGISGSSLLNPAAVGLDSTDEVTLSVKPSKLGMEELNPVILNADFRLDSNWSIGTNIYNLGGELYSEFSGELKIAARVSDIIRIGLSLEYDRLNIRNYNSENQTNINIGTVLNLSNELKAGFLIRNLLRNYSGITDKTAYQESVAGLSYQLSKNIIIDSDISIIINSLTSLGMAIKYSPMQDLEIRSAFKTNPQLVELQAGFLFLKQMKMMVGLNYHAIFGIGSEISLGYNF